MTVNLPTNKNFFPFTTNINCNLLTLKNHNDSSNTTSLSLNSNQKNEKLTNIFIGSLNTRGLNNLPKLTLLSKYLQEKEFTIFGISETKLSEKNIPKHKLGPYHTIWNPANNTQAGTSIFIHENIFNHYYKSTHLKHYITSCFFQFKQKTKLCITQVYIPHDITEKKKTTLYLSSLIQQNLQNNILHIIMGDFNATPKPSLDREHTTNTKPESKIYNKLKNNFYDSFRTIHPTTKEYTCSSTKNRSRIDQIWIQEDIIPFLLSADITPTKNTFYSDHKIISIILENFLDTTKQKRKRPIFIPNENLISPQS
jgi:exonuclease III